MGDSTLSLADYSAVLVFEQGCIHISVELTPTSGKDSSNNTIHETE